MSRYRKLVARFLSKPRDFTFDELKTLLKHYGYDELPGGRSSGSRAGFFRSLDAHIIRLHKPHPTEILKRYQLDEIEKNFRVKGLL